MNILYLCDEYPPGKHGGIGTVVQLLAREMVRQGHNVVVVGFYDWGYGGENEFDDQGVKVYRFRRVLSSEFFEKPDSVIVRAVRKLLDVTGILQTDIAYSLKKYRDFVEDIITRHSIDVIEMTDYNDYLRFCKRAVYMPVFSVPTVVKLHGSITYFSREVGDTPPQYIVDVEKQIITGATKIAGVSKYTAEKTAEYFHYSGEIDVLYNGIQMPQLPDNTVVKPGKVVYTGSLAHKKGIYSLIEAWNKVIEKHPEARLYIYGKGPEDKIKSGLSARAASTVHFEGHVPRQVLFDSLSEANLAIFPSFAECFALGPMEAMACKTAVIYTMRTSGRELINDGENGLLVDPANIDDIVEKICYLLENNDFCKQVATAGYERVKKDFSIAPIVKEHIHYYQNTIEAGTSK